MTTNNNCRDEQPVYGAEFDEFCDARDVSPALRHQFANFLERRGVVEPTTELLPALWRLFIARVAGRIIRKASP